MTNKILILLIIIIAAVTIVVVSWRTPTSTTLTPTPTVTQTPTVTDPFAVTPTVTVTATATATPTVTATATPTPTATATPTPTISGAFDDVRNTAWTYGVTEQTVGSSVYFIDSAYPKLIKKGSSKTDVSATTVFTSVNNGEIGSFYVNGGSMYVVTKRDSATSYSRFQKVTLSNSAVAKLYEFFSAKYEATQFAVLKSNDAKSGFYIGLEGVSNTSEPAAMYIKNYTQQWIKPFVGVDKTATIIGLAPTTDLSQVAGLFLKGATQSQAYVDVD